MSAIDNAFIRAYTTGPTAPSAPPAATAVRSQGAVQIAAPPKLADRRTSERTSVAKNQTAKSGGPHFAQSASRGNTQDSVIPAPHINLASFAYSVTTLDPPPPAAPIPVRIDPPATARYAPHTISTTTEVIAEGSSTAADILGEELPIKHVAAETKPEPIEPRPAFEVDRFSWPEVSDSLIARIGVQTDELCQELMAEAAIGRKVIAVSGCARDEGETTLTLVLARRLAASGAKVALVDADFGAPQLAGRLGLVIGIGWETVLALPEKTSLWETMVESIEDRLTVVPLASRSRLNVTGEIAARLADCLTQLRDAFDIVLLDAGPISADPSTDWLATPGNGLDAAILVCDVRTAKADRLAAVSRRLLDAQIAPLGVAENFCD